MVEVCGYPEESLPSLRWMPSRIPVRDALVAFVPEGTDPPPMPYSSSESRWYPIEGGVRLAIPYDGQAFSGAAFQRHEKFWDHSTCDRCSTRISAMTLCYVTEHDTYVGLCVKCYGSLVASKLGTTRALLWRLKQLVGFEDPA
jgi:hypothetical protein